MNPGDDDWVKAAMTDDTMVVEILARLHHASSTPIRHLKQAAFPLEWTVRQLRSKPVSVTNTTKKQAPRASPTTPLSWSGGTSYSGGCGGGCGDATSIEGCLEESSRPSKTSTSARSKSEKSIPGGRRRRIGGGTVIVGGDVFSPSLSSTQLSCQLSFHDLLRIDENTPAYRLYLLPR